MCKVETLDGVGRRRGDRVQLAMGRRQQTINNSNRKYYTVHGVNFHIHYPIEVRTKYEHAKYEFVVRNFVTNSYFGGIICN